MSLEADNIFDVYAEEAFGAEDSEYLFPPGPGGGSALSSGRGDAVTEDAGVCWCRLVSALACLPACLYIDPRTCAPSRFVPLRLSTADPLPWLRLRVVVTEVGSIVYTSRQRRLSIIALPITAL